MRQLLSGLASADSSEPSTNAPTPSTSPPVEVASDSSTSSLRSRSGEVQVDAAYHHEQLICPPPGSRQDTSMVIDELDPHPPKCAEELRMCQHCGRKFNPVSLEKHKAVCQSVFRRKSPGRSRPSSPPKSHSALERSSQPSSTATTRCGSTGPWATKPCPHCGRVFRLSAYSTHVNVCQSVFPTHDTRQCPRSPRARLRARSREDEREAFISSSTQRSRLAPCRGRPVESARSLSPARSSAALLELETLAAEVVAAPCQARTSSSSLKSMCEERANRLDRARLTMKMNLHGMKPKQVEPKCVVRPPAHDKDLQRPTAEDEFSGYLSSLQPGSVLALAKTCSSASEFASRFPAHLQDLASGLWRRCSEFYDVQEKLLNVREQGARSRANQVL